jgi:hypothetical protein
MLYLDAPSVISRSQQVVVIHVQTIHTITAKTKTEVSFDAWAIHKLQETIACVLLSLPNASSPVNLHT